MKRLLSMVLLICSLCACASDVPNNLAYDGKSMIGDTGDSEIEEVFDLPIRIHKKFDSLNLNDHLADNPINENNISLRVLDIRCNVAEMIINSNIKTPASLDISFRFQEHTEEFKFDKIFDLTQFKLFVPLHDGNLQSIDFSIEREYFECGEIEELEGSSDLEVLSANTIKSNYTGTVEFYDNTGAGLNVIDVKKGATYVVGFNTVYYRRLE